MLTGSPESNRQLDGGRHLVGTSASSPGQPSGVPLVPPWVDDPEDVTPLDSGDDQDGGGLQPPSVAPPRRFRAARRGLGAFATSGSSDQMRRGLGHYAKQGLGGASHASERLAGTARKAGDLYGILDALSADATPDVDLGIDPTHLAGRSAREIVDRIAAALSGPDGTQDAEVSRDSISRALCDLIRIEPTVDLTALTLDQIELAVEFFIAADICRRIDLDVGKSVFAKAPNVRTASRRLDGIYRYVKQSVAACFRRQRAKGAGRLTRHMTSSLASRVIHDTFHVFESYLS